MDAYDRKPSHLDDITGSEGEQGAQPWLGPSSALACSVRRARK